MAKFARSPIIQAPDLASALGQQTAFNKEVQAALQGNLTLKENTFAELITQEVTGPEPVWHYVRDTGEPAFQNSWAKFNGDLSFERPRFCLTAGGLVVVEGLLLVPAGAVAATSVIFTLPEGYRPSGNLIYLVQQGNGAAGAVRVDVVSDGNVRTVLVTAPVLAAGNYVSLGSLIFPATGHAPVVPGAAVTGELLGATRGTAGVTHVNRTQWPVKITLKRIKKPAAVLLAQVQDISTGNSGNSGVVTHATAPDWVQTADNKISIRSVGGLLPGRKYKITFLVLG